MDAVPEILRALGELAPEGRAAGAQEPAPPLEELVIELSDPRIDESEGRRRAAGRARVEHRPAEGRPARSGWTSWRPWGGSPGGRCPWLP